MTAARAVLTRDLKVGECISFDNGRLTVSLREKSGKAARLRFEIAESVVVDRQPLASAAMRDGSTPLDPLKS